MPKMTYKFFCLLVAAVAVSCSALAQSKQFISVDGPDLKARIDAAVKQGRSGGSSYWTAYSFDVRPGVAVDYEWKNSHGVTHSDSGISISTSDDPTIETRNLGIFLLRNPGGDSVTRVEVYNLDRQREYSGYPVYWLGRASNDESIRLLKNLAETYKSDRIAEHSVIALALHDDPRVGGILKDFIRNSSEDRLREPAVFWLGQIGGETPFLADLVRNQNENTEIRKKAVFSIGVSKDAQALSTLRNLYSSSDNREVRKQIVFAASINRDEDAGVDFLIESAEKEPDREVRKQAIFWLGQKAGKRSLEALGNTVNSSDADTEVQKQAVFAISQRDKSEAVPLLIKVARTHPKGEVRKQAIFWLGQIDDEQALQFFKEILSK